MKGIFRIIANWRWFSSGSHFVPHLLQLDNSEGDVQEFSTFSFRRQTLFWVGEQTATFQEEASWLKLIPLALSSTIAHLNDALTVTARDCKKTYD